MKVKPYLMSALCFACVVLSSGIAVGQQQQPQPTPEKMKGMQPFRAE